MVDLTDGGKGGLLEHGFNNWVFVAAGILVFTLVGIAYLRLQKLRKKKRKPRTQWVNPYLQQRLTKGRFALAVPNMRNVPHLFKENFRMTPAVFDDLLALLEPRLMPILNTRPDDGISPAERLCITLEFVASGILQRHLASIYRVSKQRIGPIIEETCKQLVIALQELQVKTFCEEFWIKIANEFHQKWNFPHCLGAFFDGKHASIQRPGKSGSLFYNYKGFFSIVLFAVCDANYRFLCYDIGGYGSEGDSTVFQNSKFGKSLLAKELNIPSYKLINGKPMPYEFVADDAFPLHNNIMKPFKPAKKNQQLSAEEVVFNYRLSRARRCIENAFGILCSRWICLRRTLFVSPDRAQHIVAACCMLHNYLLQQSKEDYCPAGFDEHVNENGDFVGGNWRSNLPEDSIMHTDLGNQNIGRPTKSSTKIRNNFKEYFNSTQGSVEWQRRSTFFE